MTYSISVDRFMAIFGTGRERAEVIKEFEHMAFKNVWERREDDGSIPPSDFPERI